MEGKKEMFLVNEGSTQCEEQQFGQNNTPGGGQKVKPIQGKSQRMVSNAAFGVK